MAHQPTQDAPEALPDALAKLFTTKATMMRAPAGRMVISPELRSTNVYQVVHGRVQVALLSSAGRQVILRDIGVGELFGELAAIDDQPRSASIFSLDDCMLASVPGPLFREAVFGDAALAEWLARRLAAQIRDLTGRVFELNALRVAARLHCELLRLCGTATGDLDHPVIEPAPTHAEFASRIGTHREAVTRELGYLAGRDIIAVGRRRITVLDLPALVNLVRAAAGQPAFEVTPDPDEPTSPRP